MGSATSLDDAIARARAAVGSGRPVLVGGGWGEGRRLVLDALDDGAGPSALVVHDVHAAGATELAAVRAALAAGPGVLAASVERGARLPARLRRALLDAGAVAIELRPLTPAEVGLFVAGRWARPGREVAGALHRRSGGLPDVLAAIVADGLDAGHLSVAGDVLVAAGDARAWSGARVTALVDAMLDDLTAAGREAVAVLMALGPLPVPLAERLVDERALDHLVGHGIATERGAASEVGLVADVLVSSSDRWVTAARRRRAVRAAAAALAEVSPGDVADLTAEQQVRLGSWCARGRGPLPWARAAIRPAIVLGDLAAAIEIGTYAHRLDPSDVRTADDLVMAYEAVGRHDAAAIVVDGATGPTAGMVARAATNTYLATRDGHRASSGAIEPVEPDDDRSMLANRSWLELFTGDVTAATSSATAVLTSGASGPQARAWATVSGAMASVVAGGGTGALDLLDLGQRIADTEGPGLSPYSSFQVRWTRCLVLTRLGRADEAADLAATELAACADPLLAAGWHGAVGLAAREAGHVAAAVEHLDAVLAGVPSDPFGLLTWARSERAACAALLGQEVDDEPAGEPIGFVAALALRNRAWVAAARGEAGRAAELARRAAETARTMGQSTHEVLALVDLARFGEPLAALAAVEGVGRVENPLVRAGARVIGVLRRRDVEPLLDAAALAVDVGWSVVAAELTALGRAAAVHHGLLATAACLELVDGPETPATPILRERMPPRSTTGREREVGRLAVAGATSAGIAERLGVSRRTVDNLLGRLYVKCAVGGRAELAATVDALSRQRARRGPAHQFCHQPPEPS